MDRNEPHERAFSAGAAHAPAVLMESTIEPQNMSGITLFIFRRFIDDVLAAAIMRPSI
jgi:hypothetical protein